MQFVYIQYFAARFVDTASEGVLTGDCSEAFRSTNEINPERVRKGLETRTKRLRSKRPVMPYFFVYIFHHPSGEAVGLKQTFLK